jgi:type II secretion system protein G
VKREKGFTLIELMIVVMIVGIIAAIAIPNLMTAIERSRQKRTMADMRTVATAWEARNVETGRFNAAGTVPGITNVVNVDDLDTQLSPTYIKSMPHTDGWKHPFELYTDQPWGSSAPAPGYAIISPGRDGRFSTSTGTSGATTNFDCDIVYSNGSFLQYPQGLQTSTQ